MYGIWDTWKVVWQIIIGNACDWHKCAKPGWKVRVDHGGSRFLVCAEHAVEGKQRNYWQGDSSKCVHNIVAVVGGYPDRDHAHCLDCHTDLTTGEKLSGSSTK
jgi:hypothetical protein